MYANPEYGGNRPPTIAPGSASGRCDRLPGPSNRPIGWTNAHFEGDTAAATATRRSCPTAARRERQREPVTTSRLRGLPDVHAGSPPDLLVLDPETLAAIQAALANLSIG
jgi:hypothetical protein